MLDSSIPYKIDEDILFDPESLIKSNYSSNQDSLNLSLPYDTASNKNFLSPTSIKNHGLGLIKSSNFFPTFEGESFDQDKLEKLLGNQSCDSYITSEELLINEDIDFLYEQSSEHPSSCVTTSLNYSKSEQQSSIFDSIRFSNAFELSLPNPRSGSKCFSRMSYETQDPGLITERFDMNYEPSDRYKIKIQKISENIHKDKESPAINTDGTDDDSEKTQTSRIEKKSKNKLESEDTACCKSCNII